MSETPDDTPTKEQIADSEDIVQSRRLNSIFDIRDNLRESRKVILMERYNNKGFNKFQALSGYRTLANNYLMELQPLLEKFEPGEKLLTERDFGSAYIVPKYRVASSNTHGVGEKIEILHSTGEKTMVSQKPEPQEIELTGLKSIWKVADPLQTKLKLNKFDTQRQTTIPQPVTIKDQFSVQTTDRFVRSMNMFLSQIGFELEPEEDKPPHQI